MVDILVRDVPDDVLARLNKQAAELGLSTETHVLRVISQAANRGILSLEHSDFHRFAEVFSDLADHKTIDQAWASLDT